MANLIGQHMEETGTKFIKKCVPTKLEKPGDKIIVTWENTETKETETGEFDTVLFAIGRYALTEGLNLANAGVVAEKNGKIKANDVE